MDTRQNSERDIDFSNVYRKLEEEEANYVPTQASVANRAADACSFDNELAESMFQAKMLSPGTVGMGSAATKQSPATQRQSNDKPAKQLQQRKLLGGGRKIEKASSLQFRLVPSRSTQGLLQKSPKVAAASPQTTINKTLVYKYK